MVQMLSFVIHSASSPIVFRLWYSRSTLLCANISVKKFLMVKDGKSENNTITPEREHKYLHCKECGGYYDLQKGESIEDYGNCQCGGELEYSDDS